MGQMICLPFFFWLAFTIFDFGNIDQFFAILGIAGFIVNFTKWKNNIYIMAISLLCMLSPLVSRLVQVPIEKFDYLAFQIPLIIFIAAYVSAIALQIWNKIKHYCGPSLT